MLSELSLKQVTENEVCFKSGIPNIFNKRPQSLGEIGWIWHLRYHEGGLSPQVKLPTSGRSCWLSPKKMGCNGLYMFHLPPEPSSNCDAVTLTALLSLKR